MERNSEHQNDTEEPTKFPGGSEKEKNTKKKLLRHVPLQAPTETKAIEQPKIVRVFNGERNDSQSNEESLQDGVELQKPTAEETQHITAEIAAQHLHIAAEADPAVLEQREYADDFLHQVNEGADPEEAFVSAAYKAGMNEDEIALALSEMTFVEFDDEVAIESAVENQSDIEDGTDFETDQMPEEQGWELPLRSDNEASIATEQSSTDRSATGGSSQPPTPPNPLPVPTPSAGDPNRPPLHATSGPVIPETAAFIPTTAVAERSHNPNRAPAGQILVGALVGYLIGRRRGRIKTEKRMNIVQRKLESHVVRLEQDITKKEQQLISIKNKQQQTPVEKSNNSETVETIKQPTEQRLQPGRSETRLGMQKPERAEKIAHLIVAAEAPKTVIRKTPEKSAEAVSEMKPKSVKGMNREELLAVSDKIIIEGASLRKVYENHLIGERQLRHLVGEHLQGKDIHKALRREMVEREIDFERDPILRDRIHSEIAKEGSAGGLGSLLASAGVTTDTNDSQLKRQMQKAAAQEKADQKRQKQQTTANLALVTAVVLLSIAIVVLTFNR